MANNEAEISKFIAERRVTKCPPAAAAVLGESSPGWRRNAERQAERRKGKSASKVQKRQQSKLVARWSGDRISAVASPSGYTLSSRGNAGPAPPGGRDLTCP